MYLLVVDKPVVWNYQTVTWCFLVHGDSVVLRISVFGPFVISSLDKEFVLEFEPFFPQIIWQGHSLFNFLSSVD